MSDKVERLNKDGKVAVLVSHGYGAGWSTWNTELGEAAVFDADIARAVLSGDKESVDATARKKYPEACHLGVDGLRVEWVDEGDRIEITEYDGFEGLRILDPADGYVA